MKLLVTGRHVAVTPALREQIERRLEHLQRHGQDGLVSAQCVLSFERQRYLCECTIHLRDDRVYHGVGRDARPAMAVAQAMDRVSRQAERIKGRRQTERRGRGGRAVAPAAPAARRRIRRSTRYVVKPMSTEDAALVLDESALGFVVFRDATSEKMAILYRRADGDLGLIEPGD